MYIYEPRTGAQFLVALNTLSETAGYMWSGTVVLFYIL